jgi:hypothetical protein
LPASGGPCRRGYIGGIRIGDLIPQEIEKEKALPFLGADSLYFRDGTAACAYYIAAACT